MASDYSREFDQRHIILSDLHYRNYKQKRLDPQGKLYVEERTVHDPRALTAVERFMTYWHPTNIWYIGDMVDTAQVSRHPKDLLQIEGFSEDIQGWREIIKYHKQLIRGVKQVYMLGNHEAWLYKFVQQNAPALAYFPGLSWEEMIGPIVPVYPYRTWLELTPGLRISHGYLTGKNPGDSARKYLNEFSSSGITGHVHKLQVVPRKVGNGYIRWAENGCLCKLDPDYAPDNNWMQGFSVVYVNSRTGEWKIEQAQIYEGTIFYGGRIYRS